MKKVSYIIVLLIGFITAKTTDSFQFVDCDFIPQAVSRGGALSSAISEPLSMLYNPAIGSFNSDGNIINYSQAVLPADISSYGISYFGGESLKFLINFTFMGSSFEGLARNNEEIGDLFSKDYSLSYALAYLLNDNISLGVSLKLLYSGVYNYSDYVLASDIGITFNNFADIFIMSFVIKNLGINLSELGKPVSLINDDIDYLNLEKSSLPLSLTLGTAYNFSVLKLFLDLSYYFDNQIVSKLGVEYNIKNITLSVGYSYTDLNKNNISAGIDYKLEIPNIAPLKIAYAIKYSPVLEAFHYFSISLLQ